MPDSFMHHVQINDKNFELQDNAARKNIDSLKDIANIDVINGTIWEKGFINASGANVNSDTLIRIKYYVDISTYTDISTTIDDGYKYAFYFYDSDKVFISRITLNSDSFNHLTIPQNARYMRMVISDINDGPAEINYANHAHIYGRYRLIDTLHNYNVEIEKIEGLKETSLTNDASWAVGSISAVTGVNTNSNTRIRTNNYIDVSEYEYIKCTIDNGYKYSIVAYDNAYSYTGQLISWTSNNEEITMPSSTHYIRICVADSNDETANINYAEHFNAGVETPLSELATKVSILDGIEPSLYLHIPDYFKSNLETSIESIKEYMLELGRDGDAFVFISDCHWNKNTKHSPALINEILKKTSVGMVVNGGDFVYAHETTKDGAYNEIYDCVQAFKFTDSRIVPFNLYGNHDNNTNNNNDTSTYLTQKELYDCLVREHENEIVFGDYNYYYFDKESAKIRYIFLMWGNNELPSQSSWIATVMSTLPNEYKAIVFHHGIYAIDSSNNIVNQAQFILDAFEPYKSNVICFVQGHAHSDAVYYAYNGNEVPIILTDTDSLLSIGSTATPGTITEQCIDVMIVNKSERKIKCVRIGRGSNRQINY